MSIKKILVVTSVLVTEIVASQAAAEPQSNIAQSWYARLMAYWEHLGTHIQLGIQLALVVMAFYALTCFFKCNKKCGCVGLNCNCDTIAECDCDCKNCTCKPGCSCDCKDGKKCTCHGSKSGE